MRPNDNETIIFCGHPVPLAFLNIKFSQRTLPALQESNHRAFEAILIDEKHWKEIAENWYESGDRVYDNRSLKSRAADVEVYASQHVTTINCALMQDEMLS